MNLNLFRKKFKKDPYSIFYTEFVDIVSNSNDYSLIRDIIIFNRFNDLYIEIICKRGLYQVINDLNNNYNYNIFINTKSSRAIEYFLNKTGYIPKQFYKNINFSQSFLEKIYFKSKPAISFSLLRTCYFTKLPESIHYDIFNRMGDHHFDDLKSLLVSNNKYNSINIFNKNLSIIENYNICVPKTIRDKIDLVLLLK